MSGVEDFTSLEAGTDYQPQKRLLSKFIKGEYPIPTEEERQPYPFPNASFFSKVFFWWVTPVLKVGYSRTLRPADLYYLTDDIKIEKLTADFNQVLDSQLASARAQHEADPENQDKPFEWPKYTIAKAVIATFKSDLIKASVFASLAIIFMSLTPLLMKQLIKFVQEISAGVPGVHIGQGIGYAFGCSFALAVTGFLFNHYFYFGLLVGVKTKTVLITSVLDKSFKLSAKSRKRFTPGKITSLMGTDLSRIEMSMVFQPLLFILPISLGIGIAILLINIGVSSLIGLAVFLFFLVIIGAGTGQMYKYRDHVTKLTDNRVGIIKEVLSNLKMIKFYSWEVPYLNKIITARSKEISTILRIQAVRNIITSVALSLTGITAMVSFLVLFALNGKTKDPASVFSSVSTFEILAICVFMLPMCLTSLVDLLNAFKRTEKLLCAEEETENPRFINIDTSGPLAIDIKNATFIWDTVGIEEEPDEADLKKKKKEEAKKLKELKKLAKKNGTKVEDEKVEEKATKKSGTATPDSSTFQGLSNIDLSVAKGEFVVITGLIGSGKSSLLQAISGTMFLESGSTTLDGSYLMCGEPWVQNETIKENILFGSEYSQKKYDEVIYSCSLQQDLEMLEAGDYTEVGERGITLSGGQKARINLARAVYSDSDIILLDDVLSAVDARVGRHIMANCILGYLKNKTRILATHQLSLIQYANRVVYVNGDGSIDVGTVDELKERNPGFQSLMSYNSVAILDEEDEVDDADIVDPTLADKMDAVVKTSSESDESFIDLEKKDISKGKMVTEEERAVNRMSLDVYIQYIRQGTAKLSFPGFIIVFCLSVALGTFCDLFTNTWLSFWISHKFPGKSDGFYMGIYAMLTFCTVIFVTLEFFVLVTVTTSSSKNLNLMAVKRLLHAPMSFLDVTPTGRILNRFTKDTDALDNEINEQLRMMFFSCGKIIGILVLCIIYVPWVAIAVPPLAFIFVCLADYFQSSTREIKRLEAVQRSFVYNNFAEALNGMTTIKAYYSKYRFMDKNYTSIDNMNEATILVFANQRWLALMLELMLFFFSLLVSLCCVFRVFKINAASAGLIVSYAFNMANELSQFIRIATQVENDMNSAERICQYAFHMEQEADFSIQNTCPDSSWPQHGGITFDRVNLKYRKGLPNVLNNLTFNVSPGEKIGICGRTGAGKSSIMTALFRLAELDSGKISIDGVDISELGLHDLRSKLSIIPQDPVLFNGTIRKNLDPFNEYPDDEIWKVLLRAGVLNEEQLAEARLQTSGVAGNDIHKFHLDQTVEEQGSNFSLGERQLISFARALLRNTKILVLDEATSSVDYDTDAKIQQTIVREFSDCTILCIAHRLKTIINYDKILTLDKGSLAEFDSPWNLYNQRGIFYQICEKASIEESDFLRK
ncbi:oligomycin resistance ATP-dependent permease Yor1p [[Candida] anglica]|uniref:Oligomycin resistance ATP-dependent permease Yor1p n=1 Tax=[Candida] anglica TaxID=148631 RepID=A0ABP0EFU2_9ASCO